ncbi:MAG TPA: FAD-dependent monooxygenase [Anaerolineales bacterium]|nr:FAD-dependent monooxygenase [Anaerolineales bacterium]
MATNKNILISGAGISGLTLAYWLQKRGFSPTIIEKRRDLHEQGYMIDFYGSGYDVAEKMNLIEQLGEKSGQYPISKLEFVDDKGKPRASLDVNKFRELLEHRYFPLMRGDLETTIYESIRDEVPIRFGVSANRLKVHDEAVEVELSNGESERYDLVIGADGIHSNIRRLMWGNESQFKRFLGFYVVCSVIDNDLFDRPNAFYGYFAPKAQTTVYSNKQNKLALFFAFKSELLNTLGRKEQMEIFTRKFGTLGWMTPKLVEAAKRSDDFFFDGAAQIELEDWHKGRVALVGDACQCLTLLAGQGASMGMAGAYLLADELYKADGDYNVAFPAYQEKLKPEIERRQKEARGLAGGFVPDNRFGIALTYLFLKVMFMPGFRSLFRKQIGAESIIK